MPSKLSKADYEKALSAEYGFPVFLKDDEFERLSASKTPVRPAAPYQDPFAYVDEAKKAKSSPDHWTTQQGATYNSTHGRVSAKAAPPVLSGVPKSGVSPAKPVAPASASIGKVGVELPKVTAAGTPLTAATSMPVGVEYLNGVDPNPWVDDLGGDDRPTTLEEKIADEERAKLLAVPGQLATLPSTYKQAAPAPYAPKSMLPQWQSDEDEVDAMFKKYAALGK